MQFNNPHYPNSNYPQNQPSYAGSPDNNKQEVNTLINQFQSTLNINETYTNISHQ